MTKKEAIIYFKEWIQPHVKDGDKNTVKEAWVDLVERLHQDGKIKAKQKKEWLKHY